MNIDIDYINKLLLEDNSVKDIRSMLGIGEKAYQREIKALGYKYNQKTRQYELVGEVLNPSTTNNIVKKNKALTKQPNKNKNDNDMLFNIQEFGIDKETFKNNIMDLVLNYEKIKNMLDDYEHISNIQSVNIVDVNPVIKIENPYDEVERTTVRVSGKILKSWNEFCDNHKEFSKKDLLGQALLEFIRKYK